MPKPSNIDDEAMYRIKVRRPIALDPGGRALMMPNSDNVVKGSVVKGLADEDVISAEPA